MSVATKKRFSEVDVCDRVKHGRKERCTRKNTAEIGQLDENTMEKSSLFY